MQVQSTPVLFEAAPRGVRPLDLPVREGAERRARESAGEEAGLSFPHLMNTRQHQAQPGAGPKGDHGSGALTDSGPEAAERAPRPETGAAAANVADTPAAGTNSQAAAEAATATASLLPGSAVLPAATPVGQATAAPAADTPRDPAAASPAQAAAVSVTGTGEPVAVSPGATPGANSSAAGKALPAEPETKGTAVGEAGKPASAASASALEASAKGRESYQRQPVVTEAQLVAASLKEPAAANGVAVAARADAASAGATPVEPSAGTDDGTGQQRDAEQSATAPSPALTPEAGPAPVAQEAGGQDVATVTAAKAAEVAPAQTEAAAPAPAPTGETPQAAEARAGQAAGSTPTSGLDPLLARSVRQQVARGVGDQLGAAAGGERISIRLNPESLGQIDLSFESRENRLTVVISASTPEAEAALRENLKDLSDRIIERSSRFSHVEIRVDSRDGVEARPDAKQDNKQEGRQDQRRENSRQDGGQGGQSGQDHPGRQAHRARLAWESAMSWELADQAPGKEG